MSEERILYRKKGKHWEFIISKTSKREKIEGVIGLLVLTALLAYLLLK